MKSTKEKVSYCIGLQTGLNLRQQFSDIDFSKLNEGLNDALHESQPKLSNDEIHSILTNLKNQIEAQQKQFVAKVAEENKKQSEAFLVANKEKEGVTTLSSGLQYKVMSSAEKGAHPTPLDVVKIHYRGSFIDGKVFESSYQRGEPVVFPLNRVIAGWSEALQLMSIGDKWEVYIPPYLAYGEHGFGQEIGPNTALVFEIELLGINPE